MCLNLSALSSHARPLDNLGVAVLLLLFTYSKVSRVKMGTVNSGRAFSVSLVIALRPFHAGVQHTTLPHTYTVSLRQGGHFFLLLPYTLSHKY